MRSGKQKSRQPALFGLFSSFASSPGNTNTTSCFFSNFSFLYRAKPPPPPNSASVGVIPRSASQQKANGFVPAGPAPPPPSNPKFGEVREPPMAPASFWYPKRLTDTIIMFCCSICGRDL